VCRPLVTDASNTAAVQLEWQTSDGKWQLSWRRGTGILLLGYRQEGLWAKVQIDHPLFRVTADMAEDAVREVMMSFIACS